MPKPKKSSRQTALFDVRLRSEDRDVLLLKGVESEASSVLLSGVVVLSVIEPLTVKKLALKLTANLKLHWDQSYQTTKGSYTKPVHYNKIVFDFEWDPLNLQDYLQKSNSALSNSFLGTSTENSSQDRISTGFTTGKLTRSNPNSSSSLQSLANNSKSSTNLARSAKSSSNLASFASFTSVTSLTKESQIVLQEGNYEFPFSTIVEGSIPESIEGLPGCSLVYRLQSSIERGRFQAPLITKKHVHVIRTLTTDAPELTETVAVDNTWPQKVDYSISVPTRAVAVGSLCNIEITMVPLKKNLKLGSINMKLLEHYTYCSSTASHAGEREIVNKTIPKVTTNLEGQNVWTDAPTDLEGYFYRSEEIDLAQDKWEVNTTLQLPAELSKITQDCDIGAYIKVRHKIKFVIGLVNPDGHVSELRATLPVMLFISPFIEIVAKPLKDVDDSGRFSNSEDLTVHFHGEDVLFESAPSVPNPLSSSELSRTTSLSEEATSELSNVNSAANLNLTTRISAARLNTQDLMAPPNYEHHVYDRVYSENASPVSTPQARSGSQTPNDSFNSSSRSINNLSSSRDGSGVFTGTGVASGESINRPDPLRGTSVNDFNMTPAADSTFSSQLFQNLKVLQKQQAQLPSQQPSIRSLSNLASSSSSVALSQQLHGASSLPRRGNRPVFSLSEDDNQDYFSYSATDQGSPTHGSAAATAATANNVPQVNIPEGLSFSTGTQVPNVQTPGPRAHVALMSPGLMSPVQHLSRVNSSIALDIPHSIESESSVSLWDNTLSKVPSYETALKSDNVGKDFTPAYEPPSFDSHINLELLNARLKSAQMNESNSSLQVQASPTSSMKNTAATTTPQRQQSAIHLNVGRSRVLGGNAPLANELARSRGSSTNSSPAMSRNQSSSNLLSFSVGSGSGMTPLSGGSGGSASVSSSTQGKPSVLFPKQAHLHTVPHISSNSNSNSNSNGNSNINSEIQSPASGSLAGSASGGAKDKRSERPSLVSRGSSSSSHFSSSKKGGSFVNLAFLHKKESK